MGAFGGKKRKVMAKKKIQKNEIKQKSEKAKVETKKTKEFNGFVVIDGKDYKMAKGKADELVKRGIAKYK